MNRQTTWRCRARRVEIIYPLLCRPEEAGEAFRVFEQAIREELTREPQGEIEWEGFSEKP